METGESEGDGMTEGRSRAGEEEDGTVETPPVGSREREEKERRGVDEFPGNVNRSVCHICGHPVALKRNGVLYIHGPRSNRCGGSGLLPLQIQPSQLMPSIPSVLLPPCASASSQVLQGEVLSAVDSHGVRAGLSTQEASNQPALFQYTSAIRVLRRIPKALQYLAATELALILNDVVTQNTDDAWSRFNLCTQFLVQPRRSGQMCSLAAAVNRQLRGECESPPPPSVYRHQPWSDPLRNLMSHVASNLEEGDFKGAICTLCSEDSIADIDSAETISALQEKHPPMHLDAHIPDLI